MHFIARALDPATRSVVSVPLEAVNADQARGPAESRGLHVIELQPAAAPKASGGRAERARSSSSAAELSSLLKAGLSVVEALEALDAQQQRQAQGWQRLGLACRLAAATARGSPLGGLAALPGAPALLVASVQASEPPRATWSKRGRLPQVRRAGAAPRSRVLSAAALPQHRHLPWGLHHGLLLTPVVVPRFAALPCTDGPAAGHHAGLGRSWLACRTVVGTAAGRCCYGGVVCSTPGTLAAAAGGW